MAFSEQAENDTDIDLLREITLLVEQQLMDQDMETLYGIGFGWNGPAR